MTTPTRFDLDAAHEAFNRIDDGIGRPGDEELAAQFEAYNSQEYDRYWQAQWALEDADQLARLCPGCVEGGTGPVCDEHAPTDDDAALPVGATA